MAKGFSTPPPAKGPRLTPMEEQALMATKNRLAVAPKTVQVPGKAPIVTLEEFTAQEAPQVEASREQEVDPVEKTEALQEAMNAAFGKTESAQEPAVETVKAAVSEPVSTFGPTTCARCGWNSDMAKLAEPTDEDKIEFVRSVLGQSCFRKSVDFFGGKMRATFRSLTTPEADTLAAHVRHNADAGEITTEASYFMAFRRCQVIYMLETVTFEDKTETMPSVTDEAYPSSGPEDHDDLITRAEKAFAKRFNTLLYSLLIQGAVKVEEVYNELLARAYDADFWKGQYEK